MGRGRKGRASCPGDRTAQVTDGALNRESREAREVIEPPGLTDRTVNRLNRTAWGDGLRLCTNQCQRADDVRRLKGARSKW